MLNEKTAVVTGGARGIGRAIAIRMADSKANVAFIYASNDAAAEETLGQLQARGVKAAAYKCDVADYPRCAEVCERIVSEFGGADILVNNAGVVRDKLLLRMSEEDFDAVVDVNLKGAFNCIRHLSRALMKSAAGRIINISSISGIMGNPGQANYSASKAGLIGLTKTVAREFAGRALTCNAIAPGFIDTDMTAGLSRQAMDFMSTSIPLKRMGTATEVADVAVFLASDMASYITGEVIKVDGGLSM